MQQDIAKNLSTSMRDECLGNRIGKLHRIVSRRFDQNMRPLGLSGPQLKVLAVLMENGPVTPSTIADLLAIERSTISRNVSLMERNGWVESDSAPSGRTKTVSLTESGVEMLASANDAWSAAQSDVLGMLGPDAINILDVWLDAATETDA